MRTATRGLKPGEASRRGLMQAVDDGEEADDDEARAHENVADEEDHDDEVADDVERGEGDGIGDGAHALPEGERRHDLRGGLAHQRGDGNDGVAVGAQRVDERAQSGHGDRAVAAAVVHEDDGAAELRLGLHGFKLGEDRLDDLRRASCGGVRPSRRYRSCCR